MMYFYMHLTLTYPPNMSLWMVLPSPDMSTIIASFDIHLTLSSLTIKSYASQLVEPGLAINDANTCLLCASISSGSCGHVNDSVWRTGHLAQGSVV